MVRVCAVTAPVLLAVPSARAHWPTTMAAAVAVWVVVNVVVPVRVTVTLDAFLVCGSVSLTVTTDPDTAVTWPEAAPKPPAAKAPVWCGKVPPPGVVPPSPPKPPGREPPGRVPLNPPKPPPTPRLQAPETGWLTETVVAVIGPPNGVADDVPDVGLPKAEMHEPTVTAAAVVSVV